MIRISFYHTVVSFKICVWWLVLLASINAALPVALQFSSGCRETTGKHSVLCTRLGLLLHHGVCKKAGHMQPSQGSSVEGESQQTCPFHSEIWTHRLMGKPVSGGPERGTEITELRSHKNHTLKKDQENCSHSQLFYFLRRQTERHKTPNFLLFKIPTNFMCYFLWIPTSYSTPNFFKACTIISTSGEKVNKKSQ